MSVFLDQPDLKPKNAADSNFKHQAKTEFELVNRQLYQRPKGKHSQSRYIVLESKAFDLIVNKHLQPLYASQDKTFIAIDAKYYSIKIKEVEQVCLYCKNYTLNRPLSTRAPLEPIIVNHTFERLQIDLIDMRHKPSRRYKWILHIKDHFSKFTTLDPLVDKQAEPITEAVTQFVQVFFL